MALINCIECGKEISDKAERCVHCGFKIKKEYEIEPDKDFINDYEKENYEKVSNKENSYFILIISILLIVVGFLLLV